MIEIGPHRLLCGDVERGDVQRLLGDERADVVYSDPPWGTGNLRYWRTQAGDSTRPEWGPFITQFLAAVRATQAPGGCVWVETGARWAGDVSARMDAWRLSTLRQWTTYYRSGGRRLPAALVYSGPLLPLGFNPSSLRDAALPAACVTVSARPGGIVLDPCCGKGYSARAAVAAGMCFRGLELNPQRLEVTAAWLRRHA